MRGNVVTEARIAEKVDSSSESSDSLNEEFV